VIGARITAVTAGDTAGLAEVRQLFIEYAEWLAPFVTASTIAEEIANLPAPFEPPSGALLIARDSATGASCGCVGVKHHSDTECEIKRLFVRPGCRGIGAGRALFSAAMDAGRELGYAEALVSTIPQFMEGANAMYEAFGFVETECFEDHTHASVEIRYLRCGLERQPGRRTGLANLPGAP
jgi:GNAT superfamily N-acetyltransferase